MVTLLHILERRPPEAVHGQSHLTAPDEADAYLRALAQKRFPESLSV
jgi:hypothetical protein